MIDRTRRPARRVVAMLGWIVLAAGCSSAGPSHDLTRAAASSALDDSTWIVVGVQDLRPEHVEAALATGGRARPRVARPGAWVSGTGIHAVASALSGRPALDHLRDPSPVRTVADVATLAVRGASASLRSAHQFGTLFGDVAVIAADDLATLDFDDDAPVQLVLLDDPAAIGAVIDAIGAWNDAIDDHLTVEVFGFPGAVDDPRRDLRVPVYTWDGSRTDADGTTRIDVDGSLHDVLWGASTPRDLIWAAWPEHDGHPGGVFARDTTMTMWSGRDDFVFGAEDGASDTPTARRALADRLATELFGGPPRAWIAVRGSATVDFVDLSVFGHMPLDGRIEPWALEDIDNVWEPNENSVRYSLGAEDLGDGAVVDLGWPPFRFEVRLTGELADASWLGTPVLLGADETSWGFRAVAIEPWSRAFWLASAGGWPARADAWWPDARVGLHVVIDGTADTPVPAVLEDPMR